MTSPFRWTFWLVCNMNICGRMIQISSCPCVLWCQTNKSSVTRTSLEMRRGCDFLFQRALFGAFSQFIANLRSYWNNSYNEVWNYCLVRYLTTCTWKFLACCQEVSHKMLLPKRWTNLNLNSTIAADNYIRGRVLLYISHIGVCRPKVYQSEIGYRFCHFGLRQEVYCVHLVWGTFIEGERHTS